MFAIRRLAIITFAALFSLAVYAQEQPCGVPNIETSGFHLPVAPQMTVQWTAPVGSRFGGNYSATKTGAATRSRLLDRNDDCIPDDIAIFWGDNLADLRMDFRVGSTANKNLKIGEYEARFPTESGFGEAAFPSCNNSLGALGTFTINSVGYEFNTVALENNVPGWEYHVRSFDASFTLRCVGEDAIMAGQGRITYTDSARGSDNGPDGEAPPDGGGGTPPTGSAPPFSLQFPAEFGIDPIVIGNSGTNTIDFSTAITSSFDSDLHLSVETDALEHEDFHASITPAMIPAPGAGEGELTITTGPLAFPRVYSVKLIATANDQVFSRTFLVQVVCDPPSILGTNQPKSITAANGSQVTLEVTPSGTGPFFYQWYKGVPGMTRSPVLAANESKLIFTTRETATYWVRVSNACGTVNSGGATVTTTGTLSGPARRRAGS